MGRIKELKEKQAKGELTDDEQKELDELVKEAGEDPQVTPPVNDDEEEEEAGEDAGVDEAADKLAAAITAGFKPMQDLVKKLGETPKVEVKNEAHFIVDKQMGRVPVQKLDEVIVEVPGRQNKEHKTVTKKTVHFIEALLTGDKEKLQLLVEGTGALGGFLVPEEWSNILVEDRRDAVVMRQLATVIQVSSDTFHLPYVDTRPHGAWRSEGAAKATSTAQFGEITLTPYSYATIVGLSDELVADAQVGGSVVQIVTRQMVQDIAEAEEVAFWTGNGSGRPTGIDNYTFVEAGPGAGASDAQRADAVIAAYHRLPQGYRNNAVWAANARTLGRSRQFKDSNGQYLLLGIGVTPQPTLLGRPVYEVNSLPDGKMFFGDFSLYHIADREGIRVKQSNEATVASQSAFERDLTFVRVEERVDGELVYTRAIVELNNMGSV